MYTYTHVPGQYIGLGPSQIIVPVATCVQLGVVDRFLKAVVYIIEYSYLCAHVAVIGVLDSVHCPFSYLIIINNQLFTIDFCDTKSTSFPGTLPHFSDKAQS